jgi:DNA-binding MarR family transcriptional regulator
MTLNWLLHSYQRSLLEALYENPFRSFYLSELACLSGVDPGNTARYLEKFAERKIISVEKNGRRSIVSANLGNPETRKIFELFELSRTAAFIEDLGDHKQQMKTLVSRVVEVIPDTRLLGLQNANLALMDLSLTVPLAIVVGSAHDITAVHRTLKEIINEIGFAYTFQICVYTCDDLPSAWNSEECGRVGFWQDRAILYGEGYYWEMIERQSRIGPKEELEEMAVHA